MNRNEYHDEIVEAYTNSGLQTYRITFLLEKDDILDLYYFAIDKDQKEFEDAVKAAKNKIDDRACLSEEVLKSIHEILSDHGFIYIWVFEKGHINLTEKPPVQRGFTFEIG